MKKILLLMLMAILTTGIATAQNANRSGIFLELGAGGYVGNTPRTGITIIGNTVYSKCLSGAAADFGLGYRLRFKPHWAYEAKAEAQIPLNNTIYSLVMRFMPVGFRYTSSEFWRNYSWYADINLGYATSLTKGLIDTNTLENKVVFAGNNFINAPYESGINKNGYGLRGEGIAYSVGAGINLTTHLYIEVNYSFQMIFRGIGKNSNGMLNYGIIAGVVGYRF